MPSLRLAARLLTLGAALCGAVPQGFRLVRTTRSDGVSARQASSDAACPAGFSCVGGSCPADVVCLPGEHCVDFEGIIGCAPTDAKVCAVKQDGLEAVVCLEGDGVCCHGNCYAAGTVCCNFSGTRCSIGALCDACAPGQTCGSSACVGGATPSPSSSSSPSLSLSSIISLPTATTSPRPTTSSSLRATTSSTTSLGLTSTPKTSTTAPSTSVSSTTTSKSTSTSTTTAPTQVPSVDTFVLKGCYFDTQNERVLRNGSSEDRTGMTVEKCIQLADGFRYAGVEFNYQCFWGDELVNGQQSNLQDCNDVCTGDASEICGGHSRVLIYEDSVSDPTTTSSGPIPTIHALPIKFVEGSCTQDQQATIQMEFGYAAVMAAQAEKSLTIGGYYDQFFAQSLRSQSDFSAKVKGLYNRVQEVIQSPTSGYKFSVTCDQTRPKCLNGGYVAAMSDANMVMNFCDKFFIDGDSESDEVVGTLDRNCATVNIRLAGRTRGAVILHELTHTSYVLGDLGNNERSADYAYGFKGCTTLAAGTFTRDCDQYRTLAKKPMCPDKNDSTKEGSCAPELSGKNADTFSHLAASIYFQFLCGNKIPPPPDSQSKKRRSENNLSKYIHNLIKRGDAANIAARDGSCPSSDDKLIIDIVNPKPFKISGYVHFGDSYAAGMGTALTSTDGCRVGGNNYGQLLYKFMADSSISLQIFACSGDTLDGLNSQIDSWNAKGETVGTVTIGGNDLNFSDLVYYCVITPNTATFGSTNRAKCENVEKTARELLQDMTAKGMRAKLAAAYKKILDKANNGDFQLYVAGYSPFFNADTTDCDQSSFHYFWGGYKPSGDWPGNRIVLLTQDLRTELNTLVSDLNTVISGAVDDANTADGGRNRVEYIDMTPAFEAHRWCQDGTHEPDEKNQNTWFFLSGWDDVDFNTASQDAADIQTQISKGKIVLPDAATCFENLGSNPDPYAYGLCRVAQEIQDDPTGPQAVRFAEAQADIVAGNVSSNSISWYLPTRQVKTFHPRSPGMVAYRDAILGGMSDNNQI